MTALAVAVGATTTTWLVDNDDIIAGLNYPVRLVCEDEAIEVTGAEYVTFTATERTSWTVNRGVDGTTPAAHAGLTAVTSGAVTTGAGGASPPFAQSDVTGLEAALAAAVATRYDNFEDGPKRVTIEPSGESTTGEVIITIWTGEVVDEETVAGKLTLNANQLRGELGTVAFTLSADGSALLEAGDASVTLGADFSVSVFGTVVAVGTDILPATDDTHSLGSPALRWQHVRVSNEVTAGDTAAGPYMLLASEAVEFWNSSLVQRAAMFTTGAGGLWIADDTGLHVYEFIQERLRLKGNAGDQRSEYALNHIELQDDIGGVAFKVELGADLTILVPDLPLADPAVAGQLYTYADNSGAGLVANLLTQIAAGARIVLQSNPA